MIAVDNISVNYVNDVNQSSHSHAVAAGVSRYLAVLIASWDSVNDTDQVVTSVTYGGVALTKVRHDHIATHERSELWYLPAPAVGTANIVVTTAGVCNDISVHAISLTGVKQSAPEANNGAQLTAVNPSTVNITTIAPGAWVLGISHANTNSGQVAGSGQTQIGATAIGYHVSSYEGPQATPGSVTHSYSNGTTDNFAISVMSLAPAAMEKTFTADGIVKQKITATFTVDGLITSSSSNPKAHLHTDTFEDGVLAATWDNWGGGQITESGGQLRLSTTSTSGYYGLDTALKDLTDSYVHVELVQIDTPQQFRDDFPIFITNDGGGSANELYFKVNQNTLTGFKRVSGSYTQVFSTTYDPLGHRWLRIKEEAGTLYYQRSEDGVTWVTIHSEATPFDCTGLYTGAMVGNNGTTGAAATMILDNFNVAGVVAVIPDSGKYRLNGDDIPVPSSMTRDFVFIKTDYVALNGRLSRDLSAKKEKWMLGYKNITKAEADALQAIIELNIPVSFVVDDGVLQIDTTVWPYIGVIDNVVLGDNNLVDLSLELIEEEAS